MAGTDVTIAEYVRKRVRLGTNSTKSSVRADTVGRIEKAFSLLPEDVLELFISEKRLLTILVEPDLKIPFGMGTRTVRGALGNEYSITIREEHEDWPEDLFLGAFLRELAHVVRERPPEDEWPAARGDRARFRERIECLADAMVWRWGLRHYSMRHLYATYPEHWVETILAEIGKALEEDEKLF